MRTADIYSFSLLRGDDSAWGRRPMAAGGCVRLAAGEASHANETGDGYDCDCCDLSGTAVELTPLRTCSRRNCGSSIFPRLLRLADAICGWRRRKSRRVRPSPARQGRRPRNARKRADIGEFNRILQKPCRRQGLWTGAGDMKNRTMFFGKKRRKDGMNWGRFVFGCVLLVFVSVMASVFAHTAYSPSLKEWGIVPCSVVKSSVEMKSVNEFAFTAEYAYECLGERHVSRALVKPGSNRYSFKRVMSRLPRNHRQLRSASLRMSDKIVIARIDKVDRIGRKDRKT